MMRKFTALALVSLVGLVFFRCQEEIDPPAAPSFTVNRNSGLANSTEFVFTVNQVAGNAIALLPFGTEFPNKGGILINPGQFVGGQATVRFSYNVVGTFNAVVVASNFSSTGEEIKRTLSAPTAITISSDRAEISEFSFPKRDNNPASDSTKIDQTARTIQVFVPFGTNVTNLIAKYTSSQFSTIRVGTSVQENDKTANNFSNPVNYVIRSHNGAERTYSVTVIVAPVETLNTVKSASGTTISKAAKNATYGAVVDNVARTIVVLGPFDAQQEFRDSVRLKYVLDGKFAKMNIGSAVLKQDSLRNLTSPTAVSVVAQNNATANYNWYWAIAPKLDLNLTSPLLPVITGKTTGFNIELRVLKGTNLAGLNTTSVITARPGTTITAVTANGTAFTSGGSVAYTDSKAEFKLTVNDSNLGISYVVTYNVKVTVLE